MQFLTKDQCLAWTSAQGFPFDGRPDHRILEDTGFHHTHCPTPADSGARVALARFLWNTLSDRSERLLWVTEWSVWPSSEHMPLNSALRQAFGETRHLIDVPGHLFQLGEDETGLSFYVVAMLFFWDAYLLGAGGDFLAFISHDEYGVVMTRDVGEGIVLEQQLAKLTKPAA